MKLKFLFPDIIYENNEFENKISEEVKEYIHVMKIEKNLTNLLEKSPEKPDHEDNSYAMEGCYEFKFIYNWPLKN